MRLSPAGSTIDLSGWGTLPGLDRLDSIADGPIAVAVSGGGDSLAALIHTCAWARGAGRKVVALSVDHGLQGQSRAWTAAAGEASCRLGAEFRPLVWGGPKPATGVAAAARAARHRLIAEAARNAGCRVIVTGHTADDQDENAALGQGRLAPWSPSPVWPEGRGLFLLRPLLFERRAALRARLAAGGWTWIDDPANSDLRSPRARVRLAGPEAAPAVTVPPGDPLWPTADPGGTLILPRSAPRAALAAALVSAGGAERPARGPQIDRLLRRIASGERFAASLRGARLVAGEDLTVARELGRAGLPSMPLPIGEPLVWDGRFEFTALAPGLSVRPMAGAAAKLEAEQQRAVRRIAAAARPALPLIEISDGTVFCPLFAGENAVKVRVLVVERYLAAVGAIINEHDLCDLQCMAIPAPASYIGRLGFKGGIYEPA